ncbi:MAG: sigma 54-interacting transcriptional regulator, partial [Desulfovibrionaceae bacterium]
GEQALELAASLDPAVVLLDVRMPGMDGFETARRMRAQPQTRRVPILFATAVSTDEQAVFQGYEAGAVDYLMQPVQPQVLRSKVRVFVEQHRMRRELAAREGALRALLDASTESAMIVDRQGRVMAANDVCAARLGATAAELAGRTPAPFLDPEVFRRRKAYVDELFREGRPLRFQDERAGRLWDVSMQPVLESGEVSACAIYSRDITDQDRYERLLVNQRDLGLALAAAPDLDAALGECVQAMLRIEDVDCAAVYLVRENGDLEMVRGQGLPEDFRRSVARFPAADPAAVLVKEGRRLHLDFDQMVDGPFSLAQEAGMASCSMVPLVHHGQVAGCLSTGSFSQTSMPATSRRALEALSSQAVTAILREAARDETMQAVRERERSRRQLQAIFQSLPDAVVTVDRDLRVLETNETLEMICGLAEEALPGRVLSESERYAGCHCHEVLGAVLRTRQSFGEQRFTCRRGKVPGQCVALRATPLQDETGDFAGAVLLVRDVTRLADLEARADQRRGLGRLVGRSEAMQQLFDMIDQLAPVDTTVLLTGESGTGKELVAEALHDQGPRASGPLVKVNCSALAESLLESELFGHVRGAFSGAERDKVGRFEAAQGGAVVLDEIGDVPPHVQLKLLRFLDYKEYERVGDSRTRVADVRIVAATNADLHKKVAQGQFRQDLYYRLMVVNLHLPPLRERDGDIPLLVDHFIGLFNAELGTRVTGVAEDAWSVLLNARWPGNVRQLRHAVEHACVLRREGIIEPWHLPRYVGEQPASSGAAPREDVTRDRLVQALEQAGWKKAPAARALGVSRPTLYRKIREFGVRGPK